MIVTQTPDYPLGPREAAEVLGISVDTLRRLSESQHIAHIRTPGGWRRYRREDLDAYVASLRVEIAGGS